MTVPDFQVMSGPEQGDSERCSHCLVRFDLATAPLCRCITRERTFVCPHCGACACDATFRAKNDFWKTASPALLARRRQEQSEGLARLQALDPKSVPRPFALIVDDDPLVLMMAEKALRAIGFTTLTNSNPEEAYSIAEAILPDLLLTDALMPRLDGRELCLRLKSNERTSGIRIVVMSALYRGSAYRSEAFRKFHVDEYLEKPIKPGILREAIDRLLPGVARVKAGATAS